MNKRLAILTVTLVIVLVGTFAWKPVMSTPDYEDFNTFTEVDDDSKLTRDYNTITWTNFRRGDTGRFFKSYGANNFTGDYEHWFDFDLSAIDAGGANWWVNQLYTLSPSNDTSSGTFTTVVVGCSGQTNKYRMLLRQKSGGQNKFASWSGTINNLNPVYCVLNRSGTTSTLDGYSTTNLRDAGGNGDVFHLSGSGVSDDYEYVIISRNGGSGNNPDYKSSGILENLALCRPSTTYEYIIITKEPLAADFQILADWKAQWVDGAKVLVMNDGATKEQIKSNITHYYNNHGTKYVLLGGDVPTIPYHKTWVVVPGGGGESAWIADDYWFANLVGDNDISEYEVYIGRAPVDNAEETAHFVNKVIAYEQMNKPKANLFHAAINPDGGQDLADDCMQWVPEDYANYTLFETPQDGVTVAEYKELWRNDGIMAVHWGHGTGTTQYQISYGGNVNFKNSDTSTMNNSFWPVHTSTACYTGSFEDNDECLAEAFVKARTPDAYVNADQGAIATFMCDKTSWSAHSAMFVEMQFWALYNQSHENIGAILAESKHEFIDEANDNTSELDRSRYEWTYRQINLFGDPETPVLTKRESNITLNLTVNGENQTGGDLSGNGYVYIDGQYSGRLGETFTVSPGTQVLVTDYWESGNTGNRTTFTVWQDGPTANPRTITFVEDTTITANFTVKHCPGDVDGDGTVTTLDLLKVKLVYSGQITDPMWVRRSDVNGDGTVNVLDINIVKINMGRTY